MLWTILSGDAGVVHENISAACADLDPEVRQLGQMGQELRAADYIKAQRSRDVINAQLLQALEQVDVLVTPTAPSLLPVWERPRWRSRENRYPCDPSCVASPRP